MQSGLIMLRLGVKMHEELKLAGMLKSLEAAFAGLPEHRRGKTNVRSSHKYG